MSVETVEERIMSPIKLLAEHWIAVITAVRNEGMETFETTFTKSHQDALDLLVGCHASTVSSLQSQITAHRHGEKTPMAKKREDNERKRGPKKTKPPTETSLAVGSKRKRARKS